MQLTHVKFRFVKLLIKAFAYRNSAEYWHRKLISRVVFDDPVPSKLEYPTKSPGKPESDNEAKIFRKRWNPFFTHSTGQERFLNGHFLALQASEWVYMYNKTCNVRLFQV